MDEYYRSYEDTLSGHMKTLRELLRNVKNISQGYSARFSQEESIKRFRAEFEEAADLVRH